MLAVDITAAAPSALIAKQAASPSFWLGKAFVDYRR
jgi:hypothetical protein